MNNAKFTGALLLAKGVNTLISLVDKSRGSNLSGEKALLLDPQMVAHFKNIDPKKVIFITGTNGKSSSTNLVTHILRKNGFKVVSNLEGANLLPGIATALAKESDLMGNVEADFYVFETDERYLPLIYEQLPAANIMIMNLQKDQVQRNGDPDFIVRKLESFMGPDIRLFLNNEDARSKSFEKFTENAVFFGVEKHDEAFTKDKTYPTQACPVCSHKLEYDSYNTDNVGRFTCTNCGFSSCPKPDYSLTDVDFEAGTMTVNGVPATMPYTLPFMLYNYAAAAAICSEVAGLSLEDILKTFSDFKNIGGRFETLDYNGKTIKYCRMKQENPDTLQSALNMIAQDTGNKAVFLGLYPVHDFTPGYTNTFYTYDCDFSTLAKTPVEKYYCFSPAVCYDTALRLKYEGIDPEKIEIEETNDLDKIFSQIDACSADTIYLITQLADFEAMKKYAAEHTKGGTRS